MCPLLFLVPRQREERPIARAVSGSLQVLRIFVNRCGHLVKGGEMATGSSKAASPTTELGEKDLAELLRVLHQARNRCIPFGIQVGLGIDEIESIESRYLNADDRLRAVLTARLRKSEPLTWNDIDAALREECVGLGNTANDIRKRHPHLFTLTVSIATEYEREKQVNFEKNVIKKDADHHHHEHTVKSEDILKEEQKGSDHQARLNKERERSSEYYEGMSADDSSPECDMKNQSEVEMKELAPVFERFYGKLCCVEFNPRNIAAQLQEKALISIPVMNEMLLSPESQQAMIVSLIGALYEKIKSHPEHLFLCIEVMLENDALQKAGKEILNEAGINTRFLFIEHCLSFSAKVCPAIAAAKFPSQVSPPDLAVVVYTDVVGMQTVTICVATVVCLLRSTFILQRVRGRHKEECPAQPRKDLHSLCLHPVQVQAMLHRQRVNQYHNQV